MNTRKCHMCGTVITDRMWSTHMMCCPALSDGKAEELAEAEREMSEAVSKMQQTHKEAD